MPKYCVIFQGLPPLAKVPAQEETPNRLDRRSVLPLVKGGLVSLQARRALSQGADDFNTAGAAMPDRPARLPPLRGSNLFGPTNMPDRPLHLPPIQQPEGGKGKELIGFKSDPSPESSLQTHCQGRPQRSQKRILSHRL